MPNDFFSLGPTTYRWGLGCRHWSGSGWPLIPSSTLCAAGNKSAVPSYRSAVLWHTLEENQPPSFNIIPRQTYPMRPASPRWRCVTGNTGLIYLYIYMYLYIYCIYIIIMFLERPKAGLVTEWMQCCQRPRLDGDTDANWALFRRRILVNFFSTLVLKDPQRVEENLYISIISIHTSHQCQC